MINELTLKKDDILLARVGCELIPYIKYVEG